jgi:hypothetical protein
MVGDCGTGASNADAFEKVTPAWVVIITRLGHLFSP